MFQSGTEDLMLIREIFAFHIYFKIFDASGHIAFHTGQILDCSQGMLRSQINYDRMRISRTGFGTP